MLGATTSLKLSETGTMSLLWLRTSVFWSANGDSVLTSQVCWETPEIMSANTLAFSAPSLPALSPKWLSRAMTKNSQMLTVASLSSSSLHTNHTGLMLIPNSLRVPTSGHLPCPSLCSDTFPSALPRLAPPPHFRSYFKNHLPWRCCQRSQPIPSYPLYNIGNKNNFN